MKRIILSTLLILLIFAPLAQAQTISGTLKSFEKAFQTRFKSDGASAEDWDIRIGRMINTHPTNFLKTLAKFEKTVLRLDALVGNLGYELVDNYEGQRIEAKFRILSLKKAAYRSHDSNIRRLASLCIKQLQRYLK